MAVHIQRTTLDRLTFCDQLVDVKWLCISSMPLGIMLRLVINE